jgi:hypothetical protein
LISREILGDQLGPRILLGMSGELISLEWRNVILALFQQFLSVHFLRIHAPTSERAARCAQGYRETAPTSLPTTQACRRNETRTVQRPQHTFITLKSTLERRDLMRLIGTRSQLAEETIASSSISSGRGVQENEGSSGAGELVNALICILMFPVSV